MKAIATTSLYTLSIVALFILPGSFARASNEFELSCESEPVSDQRFGAYSGEFSFLFLDSLNLVAATGNIASYPHGALRGIIIDALPQVPVPGRLSGSSWIYKFDDNTHSAELRIHADFAKKQTSKGTLEVYSRTYNRTFLYPLTCTHVAH